MSKRKPAIAVVVLSLMVTFSPLNNLTASAGSSVLKEGMRGNEVTALQKDLKALGYINVSPTGYYGSLTKTGIMKLQREHGLAQDGIAGRNTFAIVDKLLRNTSQGSVSRSSDSSVMKEGMSGSEVTALQKNLKDLGYLSVNPTGYYGSLTTSGVKKLQANNGLYQDGKAGPKTLTLISSLLGRTSSRETSTVASTASRGNDARTNYLVSWFGGVENLFKRGDAAVIYDIWSGRTFNIKRTYGYNHADCETLTAEDTKIMLSIYGGAWSWTRRPIIVTANGRKYAASMAGMPHAGVDSVPAEAYTKKRSGGYGAGSNLDAVKGNNMDGVFDVHFLNSKTHGTNKVDSNHQKAAREAASWAEKNGY